MKGLHQIINISEKEIVDVYEPKEEGLVRVEQKRYLTILEVTLTKSPTEAEKKSAGYQPPLEVKNDDEFLTKEKWEEQEKERAEKAEKRKNRPFNNNNNERRGEQKNRGGRRR